MQHCLHSCPRVQEAWERFYQLRRESPLPPLPTTYDYSLQGSIMRRQDNPQPINVQIWSQGPPHSFNLETPWELLRGSLLWHIWTARCEHLYDLKSTSLGVILCAAWRLTIQVGQAAFKETFRYNRTPARRLSLQKKIIDIWSHGAIFCSNDSPPTWHYTPPATLIPKRLALGPALPAPD
jgi:hypothetical protein